jgi:hypothetical protein
MSAEHRKRKAHEVIFRQRRRGNQIDSTKERRAN